VNQYFIEVILAGIFFGLCSLLLIEGMKLFKKLSEKITIWAPLKGIAGGFILVILTLLFSKQYLGLGLNAIQTSLEKGEGIIWYAFILKIIFTSVTLNFGGSGGIATPIFFIGSTAGVLFAKLLGLKSSTFAAIGLVAVLAGAANTPISASIMSAELFGVGITPYASVACVISFLMTGYRSVYPSQILAIKKSASIDVEVGKEVEEIHPRIVTRDRSLIGISRKIVKKIEKQFSRKRNNPPS
jgi:H+/Cl- antiporter ClcA